MREDLDWGRRRFLGLRGFWGGFWRESRSYTEGLFGGEETLSGSFGGKDSIFGGRFEEEKDIQFWGQPFNEPILDLILMC